MELFLFVLWAASEWDIALAIGLFILGGSVSLTAWFFKKRMEAYDKHLDECKEHAVTIARMDERLCGVEGQVNSINTTIRWVGDCMLMVGSKLNAKLPSRPNN